MDVLLIEDNAANAYLVEVLLSRRRHSVTVARSGTEGVALARSRRFDVVLLDLRLPDGDGCDFVGQFVQRDDAPSTPVIAVSAHALAPQQRRAMEVGCRDFIEKPIDVATFVDRIEAVVRGPV